MLDVMRRNFWLSAKYILFLFLETDYSVVDNYFILKIVRYSKKAELFISTVWKFIVTRNLQSCFAQSSSNRHSIFFTGTCLWRNTGRVSFTDQYVTISLNRKQRYAHPFLFMHIKLTLVEVHIICNNLFRSTLTRRSTQLSCELK